MSHIGNLPHEFEFSHQEGDTFLPLEGEIVRITTKEDSNNQAYYDGSAAGFVLLKVGGKFFLGDFHESYGMSRNEYSISGTSKIEWCEFPSIPVFVWRKCESSYHFNFSRAKAEIEIIPQVTPEWLVEEIEKEGIVPSSHFSILPEMAVEFITNYADIFISASREAINSHLQGVWRERSKFDLRSLFLWWLAEQPGVFHANAWMAEFFTDSRPPYWDDSFLNFSQLMFRGKILVKVPKGTAEKWKVLVRK